MDLKLKGKVALVLASSQGLGKAAATSLAQEGATVAISSRNLETLQATKKEIGAALAIATDLQKPGAAAQLIRDVQKQLGPIDILVTNAGGPPKGKFHEITSEMWLEGFQSLWLSVTESIQAVLPSMRERKSGRIILITSTSAKEPIANLTVSNGLRAGLANLANSLSQEVAVEGITANVVMPGMMATERLKELGMTQAQIEALVPAKRVGRPKELGDLIAFLASERAAYITGQTIAVDGGRLKSI